MKGPEGLGKEWICKIAMHLGWVRIGRLFSMVEKATHHPRPRSACRLAMQVIFKQGCLVFDKLQRHGPYFLTLLLHKTVEQGFLPINFAGTDQVTV